MKNIIKIILFIITVAPVLANAGEERITSIVKANEEYKKGNYQEAAKIYEEIESTGYKNGHLFYNMGNAYFRQRELGKAILSYNRAKKLLPRDEDLLANLNYAQKQRKDQMITKQQPLIRSTFFWLYNTTFNELFLFFLFLNTTLFVLLIIKLLTRGAVVNHILTVVTIAYIIVVSSVIFRYNKENSSDHGVVLAKELNVRSGLGFDAVTLFKLHEGAEFYITEKKDNWMKIVLDDEKKGWLEKSFIGTY